MARTWGLFFDPPNLIDGNRAIFFSVVRWVVLVERRPLTRPRNSSLFFLIHFGNVSFIFLCVFLFFTHGLCDCVIRFYFRFLSRVGNERRPEPALFVKPGTPVSREKSCHQFLAVILDFIGLYRNHFFPSLSLSLSLFFSGKLSLCSFSDSVHFLLFYIVILSMIYFVQFENHFRTYFHGRFFLVMDSPIAQENVRLNLRL